MDNERIATVKLYPADASKFKQNPPAYTGPATVNGDKNYRASAWKQEDSKGNMHLSVSVQKHTPKSDGYKSNDNNDTPFDNQF
jgi:hypothetical protein|tara:strand:+ start:116 stop:364 length:249 start_codon:yes stop_codon:yes gene_type:complete